MAVVPNPPFNKYLAKAKQSRKLRSYFFIKRKNSNKDSGAAVDQQLAGNSLRVTYFFYIKLLIIRLIIYQTIIVDRS